MAKVEFTSQKPFLLCYQCTEGILSIGPTVFTGRKMQKFDNTGVAQTYTPSFTMTQYYHMRMRSDNIFGRVCLCVCLSCSRSNVWKRLPRNFIFGLLVVYIFRISTSSPYVKVIWSMLQEQKACLCPVQSLVLTALTYRLYFIVRTSSQHVAHVLVSRSWVKFKVVQT